MWHAWDRREKCSRFLWDNPEGKRPPGNLGVDGRMGSKWILARLAGGM
jgi:hypothetical protein